MPQMEEIHEKIEGGNPQIEAMLSQGQVFECHFAFGISCLNQYLEEIAAIQSGVKFKDLGIRQRYRDSQPKLIRLDGTVLNNFWASDVGEIDIPVGSIAHIPIKGFMRAEGGMSSQGALQIANNFRAAFAHPNIEGVLVETFSGGGESAAGSIIKNAISEKNKPVVAFAHMAASAAYRSISQADEIVAAGDAVEFGSIGTMIPMDVKMLSKYRDRFVSFYGQTAPEKNASIRAAVSGDFSKLQKEVDDYTLRFQNEIIADRRLKGAEAKDTVSGKMFFARDAKTRGLVDSIGNMEYALNRIKSLKKGYK